MSRTVMLTTKDNPYNPFTQMEEWDAFDRAKGYNTNGLLARIAHTSYALTDKENERIIEAAIDTIIENDFMGIYERIYEDETEVGSNNESETKS